MKEITFTDLTGSIFWLMVLLLFMAVVMVIVDKTI